MAESYDIFISYSNKDRQIVHKYAKFLEDYGYKVWYDVKGLYGGAKFAGVIADAIEASKLFVFFSSENSNKSEWTGKNGADCYSKNGHAVTVLTVQS